ncbi:MAG: RNA polymerase factor sigma-54 [candidate division WOR-3 bacterium]|nr:RNA polymerase factor sigma-54 [candidate division WOR-3 bacterium]
MMNHELRLEPKQILTPQILLNLKLLSLPNIELEGLIRMELEKNPVLEIATETNEEETQLFETESDHIDMMDFPIGEPDIFTSGSTPVIDSSEITVKPKTSIEENLLPIVKSVVHQEDFPIAEYIIGNLDENGFLTISLQEISNTFNIPLERVQNIVKQISQIEPGGIATSNLQECLLSQLQYIGFDENSPEVKIIRDYYDLLIKRQYQKIAKLLKIEESSLSTILENLSGLDPRPISRYFSSTPEYVMSDFSIRWQGDNLVGSLYDETIPVLRIAPRYREMVLSPKEFSEEEVQFAREKLKNAIMLIKGIESRKQTLKSIIQFIISHQKEFLTTGNKEQIKPISIKDAASNLNIHISTLSRAIQGKYVDTPVGIFPLRFFFTTGGSGEHSRHSIKEKIQNIIAQENKARPYTDDEIVKILAQENIKLSRRTVAKYREELKIPGSSERKINK